MSKIVEFSPETNETIFHFCLKYSVLQFPKYLQKVNNKLPIKTKVTGRNYSKWPEYLMYNCLIFNILITESINN